MPPTPQEEEEVSKLQARRQRGSGSLLLRGQVWWIKYHRNGKPYRESSRSDERRKAERLLKRRLAEVETGQFRGLRTERVRFDELAADLENDYAINRRKSATRSSRSIGHLKRFFEGWRAVEVTTDRIREYIAKRQNEGAANATINRELAALKRMFNLGSQMTPPKVARVPHIPMLKEPAPRRGFVEHQGFLKLRDALPSHLKPVLTMAYYTGMRKGEILGLRWDQVDWASRQVRLDPGTTKNAEGRTIPLTGELYEWLKFQKQVRDSKYPDCQLAFSRNGKPIKNFKNSWKAACKRAELDGLLFHDLRRSGVRNLVRAGVPERVAMAISGHKTRSVFDRYNIVSERDLQEAAQKLETFLRKSALGAAKPVASELPKDMQMLH